MIRSQQRYQLRDGNRSRIDEKLLKRGSLELGPRVSGVGSTPWIS
jgi:hypothetical protein